MRFLSVILAVVSGFLVGECKSQDENPAAAFETNALDADVEAEAFSTYIDSDDDGLCDSSERVVGTAVDNPDSDGDGFPDAIEFAYGFDALNANAPPDERVVFLVETRGASATLIARVQVEGVGEQYTGLFESLDPFSSQTTTAADLLISVIAVSANPLDNVHGVEENAARFASVQGSTELTFGLRFAYSDQSTSDCKRGYPFRFSAKRPDKSQVGTERYLLVSIPADSSSAEASWCIPEPCL